MTGAEAKHQPELLGVLEALWTSYEGLPVEDGQPDRQGRQKNTAADEMLATWSVRRRKK